MKVKKMDHFCIAVKDLDGDYCFIPNPEPLDDDTTRKVRPFRDCEYAFLHPRKMNGVLLELIDYKWKELD
jgi:methylmalonyl-CoA/ethylmalonyl-CoA epimerase